MGNSLFEQLKKSGLVDEKKAKKAKRDQHKKRTSNKGAASRVDEATRLAEKARLEKVERDRQLNQRNKEQVEQKAIAAQVRQLIETNRVDRGDGDVAYHFTDANVVRQVYVSDQVRTHLVAGRLAIVRLGDGYELVPAPVAEKIRQRDAQSVVLSETSAEPEVAEDDPYADYKIPDDLMW